MINQDNAYYYKGKMLGGAAYPPLLAEAAIQ
jgi:hypothetical protein